MTHRFKNRKNSDGIKLFQARPVFISETGGEVISAKTENKEKNEDKGQKEQLPVKPGEGVPINAENEPEKEAKEQQEESDNNPNIPPRSTDALSGSEFAKEYEKVQQDPKARQNLVIEQIAKGNVPSNYRLFEPVTIEKGGKKITINVAKRGLTIGEGDDTFELPLDGPTSRAVADMLDCTIPTDWLSDQIYRHAKNNKQTVPFYHQGDFANHSDIKMQRVEWMRKQQEYGPYKDAFAKVPEDRLAAGYFKDVIHPVPGVSAKFANGVEIFGGHYQNGKRVQKLSGRHHGETYLDYSHRTRLISRTAHIDGKKVDISEIIKDPEIAKHFGFTPLDIDKSYDYSTWSNKYDASGTKEFVEAYKKAYPAGGGPAEPASPTTSAPDTPAETAESTTQQASETETTATSQPIASAESQPQAPTTAPEPPATSQPAETQTPSPSASGEGYQASPSPAPASQSYQSSPSAAATGPATSEIAPAPAPKPQSQAESAPQHAEVQNKNKVIVLGDSLSVGAYPHLGLKNITRHVESGKHVSTMRKQFEDMKESECRGATLYVLGGTNDLFDKNRTVEAITADLQKIYTLAKARGMKVIAATPPPLGNSKYLGQTPSHVQNESDLRAKWDALNNWILAREGSKDNSGNPNGPNKVLRFHETFADPTDKYILRAEYRSEDGVHMTPTAYTLMARHVREAALQFEPKDTNSSPEPSGSVTETPHPANIIKKAQNPREFIKINNVPPINGPTAFFGSSSIAGISRVPYLKNGGHQYHAKNGLTAGNLQNMANTASDSMKNFKNAVVLIGTNDIGANKSADQIFQEIEAIWNTILRGNPNINLHVCTLPPFGNYVGYRKNKTEIDGKRLAVNEKIRQATQENPKLKLIDLCLPVEKGGLAAPDGDSLDPSVSYKQDPLHTESNALAMVFGRAINS